MPVGVYDHSHVVYPLKQFPDELVAEVRARYESGATQKEIGELVGLSASTIEKLMRRHQIPARARCPRKRSDASYEALHIRVYAARGRPQKCEWCGEDDELLMYHWANISGDYGDVDAYERLCVPCHKEFDLDRIAAIAGSEGTGR